MTKELVAEFGLLSWHFLRLLLLLLILLWAADGTTSANQVRTCILVVDGRKLRAAARLARCLRVGTGAAPIVRLLRQLARLPLTEVIFVFHLLQDDIGLAPPAVLRVRILVLSDLNEAAAALEVTQRIAVGYLSTA